MTRSDEERALIEKVCSEGFAYEAGVNLADLVRRAGLRLEFTFTPAQTVSMPQLVEVTIKRMETLADTALDGRAYEKECQEQMRLACNLLRQAYAAQPPAAPVETEEWEEVTDGTTKEGDRFSYIPNPETGVGQITSHKRRVQRSSADTADDLRAEGWTVAVHNDYRLNGERHTFWLFTKDGRAIKGEGHTDREALDQCRALIRAVPQTSAVGLTNLAETIHNARWPEGKDARSFIPFQEEDRSGQDYCTRIARAIMSEYSLSRPESK